MKTSHARLHVERLEARDLMSVGYTPAQIRHAYGFDQMWLDGGGQTIAIVDAHDDPTIAGDLRTFDQTFGLPDPPSFSKVNQIGGSRLPAPDAGWSGEIALDVEWSHVIAPRANILLVEANSASLVDLYTAVDFARQQPGVVTVSMSFGGGEGSYEPTVDNILTTPAGHIGGSGLPGGVTFVAATGDQAAPGGYPAYSPNVVAVGGTSLYLDNQGNYLGEVGWSGDPGTSGSGGGISQIEPEPAYQYSVQNTGARTIPDVAYNADPGTGVYIFDTMGSGGWNVIGGTSAGAPQWAALMALVDQARAYYLGAGSLDGPTQTLPALYSSQMSADFNDITIGYNGYFAGPGYDLVTGLGSPYAPWVVSDLVSVGSGLTPPGGAAKSTGFAVDPTQTTPFVASNHEVAVGLTKLVDAVFADPGAAVITTAPSEIAPMEIHLAEQAVANRMADGMTIHAVHSLFADSTSQGDVAGWETGIPDLNL